MKARLIPAVVALGIVVSPGPSGSAQEFPYQIFERYLEPLAQQIGMPGLSALIVRNGVIEWERGYGYQDVEKKIAATPDTPYPIGGVTQAMTGVLMGVCIDRFRFDIDRRMREFVPAFPIAGATVRQVLAHASEGRFQYDPVQFTALTSVLEHTECSGTAYRVTTAIELLNRFSMTRSVPGLDLARPEGQAARDLFGPEQLSRYDAVLRDVAVPYRIDRNDKAIKSEMPSYGLDASSGLVATVRDLYRFEKAVDDGVPLSTFTRDQMWNAAIFNDANGDPVKMPTGLGWFVQTFSGAPLVWTFGHIPDGGSALILKMPHKKLTLILLANSDRLSAGYNLDRGDVSSSPFVKIFLRLFL